METVKNKSQRDSRVLNLEVNGRKVRPCIQTRLPNQTIQRHYRSVRCITDEL